MRRCQVSRALFGTLAGLLLGADALAATPIAWDRIEDPLVRAAQFDLLMGEPFLAVTRLEADLLQGRIKGPSSQAQLVLGGMYLANGSHHKAAEIFARLGKSDQPQAVRNQAW